MLFPIIFAIALMPTGTAEDCIFLTSPELDSGDLVPGRRYYADNDLCQVDGCTASLWWYEESNGLDGLQRDDLFSPMQRDCGVEGDTIVALVFGRAPTIG